MKNCFQFPTLFKLQCIVPVIAVVISAVMGPSAAASPPGNEFSGDANRIAQRQVPVIRVLNEDAYPQKSDRELINEARSKTNNAQILINTFHFRNKTLNLAEELFNLQSERALLIQRWGIVVAGTFPQWFYKADNPATEAVLDAIRLQFTGSAYFTTLLATELSNAAIKAMLAVTPARIGRFYMTLPQPAVLRGDRWDMPAYGQPARLSMYVTPYSEGGDAFSACDVVVAV